MDKVTKKLLQSESEQLNKLRGIVEKAIRDEKLITDSLVNQPDDILTRGQQISDRVALFGGSWAFIISFLAILVAWIAFNSLAAVRERFDPYPFILMNLVLSCIAALQAPIIMMSQNRQEEKDRKRNENDYLVNLKAELEIRELHEKIDLLIEEQIKVLFESQRKQLDILNAIDKRMNAQQKGNG